MKWQIAKFCGIPTLMMLTFLYLLYYYDPANMATLRPEEYQIKVKQDSIRAAEKLKIEKKNAKGKKTKTKTGSTK